jgi:integrase
VIHHDRVLHVALKRARALRLIVNNPVDDVKRPQAERAEIEILEHEEAATLLKLARSTRLYVPIFLALATGMRRGELLALRWKDVDLEQSTLTVRQTLEQTKAGLRFKPPKTKRSTRTIALSPSVVEVLQAHKVRQLEERMKLGLGRDSAGLVFSKLDGEPLNPRNFSKEFTRLVARAGIRPVTFHGLRHTHITNLLREGVHPKIASERAGHASVAITMDVYSHAIPSLQEEAALKIDAALRTVLEQ